MKLNNKQREYLENRLKIVKENLRAKPELGYISYRMEEDRIELLLRLDDMQEDEQ